MSRLLLCTVSSLLALGLAKGASLPCSATAPSHPAVRSCVPSEAASQHELYTKALPSIPGSAVYSENGLPVPVNNQHHWLFGILTIGAVVMASILRILMADRIERFLEEWFEPMNWTTTR
jgi:hypothetical protein